MRDKSASNIWVIVDIQTVNDGLRSQLTKCPQGPGVGKKHRSGDSFLFAHWSKIIEKTRNFMILDDFVGLDMIVD